MIFFAACPCDGDPRYTGNCDVGTGKCECKEAFRGADDCSACADGYYDYPDCKPCDCFANGTVYVRFDMRNDDRLRGGGFSK